MTFFASNAVNMYKILYQNPSESYETLDVEITEPIEKLKKGLILDDHKLIGIYDYSAKQILFKCPDYDMHRQAVEELVYDEY